MIGFGGASTHCFGKQRNIPIALWQAEGGIDPDHKNIIQANRVAVMPDYLGVSERRVTPRALSSSS